MDSVIIGQECICPDGLGRVEAAIRGPDGNIRDIKVNTYIRNRGCNWAVHNVTLLPIAGAPPTLTQEMKEQLQNELWGIARAELNALMGFCESNLLQAQTEVSNAMKEVRTRLDTICNLLDIEKVTRET